MVSLKGGVGRSADRGHCQRLAASGHPAVALDLDPQNALRHHLCLGLNLPGISATGLSNVSLRKAWLSVALLDLPPGGLQLRPTTTNKKTSIAGSAKTLNGCPGTWPTCS